MSRPEDTTYALACSPFLLHLLVCLLLAVGVCEAGHTGDVECLADEAGDATDPNNIYTCVAPQVCCHEEGKASCCLKKTAGDAAKEQVVTWSAVLCVLVVVALLLCYCRHDGDCCSSCPTCCRSCGCWGRRGEGKEENDHHDDKEEKDPQIEQHVMMPPKVPAKTQPAYGADVDELKA